MFSAQHRNNKKIIEYGDLTGASARKALFTKLEQKKIRNTTNIKLVTSL